MEARDLLKLAKMLYAMESKKKPSESYSWRTFSDQYPWQKPPRAAAPITDEERESWRLLRDARP